MNNFIQLCLLFWIDYLIGKCKQNYLVLEFPGFVFNKSFKKKQEKIDNDVPPCLFHSGSLI